MALNVALILTIFLTRERWAAWAADRGFRVTAPAVWDGFVALEGRRAAFQAGDNDGFSWHLYDLTSDRKIGEVAGGFDRRCLVMSPAGDRMLVLPTPKKELVLKDDRAFLAPGEGDLTPYVIDLASGERLVELKGHPECAVHGAFSPDGRSIVTSGFDRTVRVWEAATGECRLSFQTGEAQLYHANWSRDGRRILTQCAHRRGTCTWDADTGARLADFPGFPVFCAGGSRIATYVDEAGIYDADAGSSVAPFSGDIQRMAVSPDEARVATLDRSGVMRVWDAATGAPIVASPGTEPFEDPGPIAFSPDGRIVAVIQSERSCGAMDVATGEILYKLRPGLETLRFSPRGTRLFAMDDMMSGLLHIWDARTGRPLASIHGGRFVDFIDEDRFLLSQPFIDEVASDWGNLGIIYRRIRPERWWGVFWLWHFWLIVALGVAVVWSGWRDVRRMRRLARESASDQAIG
jgi:WD40 repeat protein